MTSPTATAASAARHARFVASFIPAPKRSLLLDRRLNGDETLNKHAGGRRAEGGSNQYGSQPT
jgi:hypothetical protein